MPEVAAFGDEFTEWFAVLGVEELVWTDVGEVAVVFEQAQAGFDKTT